MAVWLSGMSKGKKALSWQAETPAYQVFVFSFFEEHCPPLQGQETILEIEPGSEPCSSGCVYHKSVNEKINGICYALNCILIHFRS